MSTDRLLSAKQIAPMLGYEPERYKAVFELLRRAGIEPWRDPSRENSRMVRWWESDILAFQRRGGGAPAPVRKHPETDPPSRFRKQAS